MCDVRCGNTSREENIRKNAVGLTELGKILVVISHCNNYAAIDGAQTLHLHLTRDHSFGYGTIFLAPPKSDCEPRSTIGLSRQFSLNTWTFSGIFALILDLENTLVHDRGIDIDVF